MKNLAKQTIVGVMLVVLSFSINIDETVAKDNEEYKENVWYEESGEITDHHKEYMKEQWCEYNEGRDFVTDQCDK